jgi:hypothetical protein
MPHKLSYECRFAKFLASKEQFSSKKMIDMNGNVFMVDRDNVLPYLKQGWTLDYTQINIYHPLLCHDENLKNCDYHKMIQLKRVTNKKNVIHRHKILIEYLDKGWVLGKPPSIDGMNTDTNSSNKTTPPRQVEIVIKGQPKEQPREQPRVEIRILSI